MPDTVAFDPLFEAVMAQMDAGVIIADEDGAVLYRNTQARELLKDMSDNGDTGLSRLLPNKPGLRDDFVRFERQLRLPKGDRRVECQSGMVTEPLSGRPVRLIITRDHNNGKVTSPTYTGTYRRSEPEIIAADPQMLDILSRIDQIAPSNAFVLLQGESGTGKTQLARMLHRKSKRSDGPFIEVNCAAIPDQLIESELFGHVKGAFTGASMARTGRFQAANGGTLFLDEVGEIPLHLQAKLLRAVQDQVFEPVGSDKSVEVDVRVVSASNRQLRDMVDADQFRADLFYRLAVIPIVIPALRNRPGDIPVLLKHFCSNLADRGYPTDIECTSEAMRLMMDYPWPGNVREMQNAVEHALICAVDKAVVPGSLPQDVRSYAPMDTVAPSVSNDPHKAEIEKALSRAKGNKAEAARLLEIDRTTLWRRMKKAGLA